MIRVFIPLILVFSWLVPAEDHIYFDKTVQKKFTAAIFNAYGTADYSLINVRDSTVLIPTGETACLNHTYRVYHADTLLGYARFESGMGRYEPFDFVVLYDPNRIIRQVEILVYRSDHGFEIMNKRWLAQFQGTHGCGLIYGKDIDAISGATLSAASLTETIAGICETMQLHPIFEND
jgi:hypothetical protein